MASDQPNGPTSLVSSAFPPPPPFYKHFTPENIAALKHHQKIGAPHDQLPQELHYLVPPPPPDASYRCFGDTWQIPDVLPSLPQMGITQLYEDPSPSAGPSTSVSTSTSTTAPPSNTRALSLLRLSKSLLLSYLELLSYLSSNPTRSSEKLQDLRTIMINMHHLINEYRPHQARETLILMMEEQVEKCKKERDENIKAKETVRSVLSVLEGMLESGLGVPGIAGGSLGSTGNGKDTKGMSTDVATKSRDLEMWQVLDGLV
ncbi:MED7 protein-domain-containing protein [Kalaharituber pfeilii]|nr:MED7 protein-domain-containing protein [Kalaharituber pfeilii]